VARTDPRRALHRSQSTVAISADGERWFLLNASPDIRAQLSCLPGMKPQGVRHVPIQGIVTTDAELDHSLGIVLLREARWLQLYSTPAVHSILQHESPLLSLTRAFAEVEVTEMSTEIQLPLRYRGGESSGITVEPFTVPAGPPRFAPNAGDGHTIGLTLRDEDTGGSCTFVPGCAELDESLLARFESTDLLLFDGTFWSDDELIRLGISDRRARQMDHIPLSGADGSLAQLAELTRPQKVYTHINNTNPILMEDSVERDLVEAAGLRVGRDGMSFLL
jgi:pyrroloquinoline quinone biosynthesis protein B